MGSARQPLIDLLLVTQLQLARRAVRGLDHDPAWVITLPDYPDLVPEGGDARRIIQVVLYGIIR